MNILWLIVIGVAGGVCGGMGMGGGTLLIPMLTIFMGFAQKQAQLINLIAFVIMAGFALIIHFKNKLVKYKAGLILGGLGILASVGTSFLANSIDDSLLKFLFGTFLVMLASIETTFIVFDFIEKKRASSPH